MVRVRKTYTADQLADLCADVLERLEAFMVARGVVKAGQIFNKERVCLLVACAGHESAFGKYRRQLGGGPARGLFGMEVSTYVDCVRYMQQDADQGRAFADYIRVNIYPHFSVLPRHAEHDAAVLIDSDRFAIVMAVVKMWMRPEALPKIIYVEPPQAYALRAGNWLVQYWNAGGRAKVTDYAKHMPVEVLYA